MRALEKTLCTILAAALAALILLPAVAFADGAGVTIDSANFPDANFRAYLLDAANLNGAGADGLLTSQELAAVTALDVFGKSIASLQGIEHFTALVSLDAGNNLLTTLDLGANTKLQYLF